MIRFFLSSLFFFFLSCALDLNDDQAGAVTAGNTGAIAGVIATPDSGNTNSLRRKVLADHVPHVFLFSLGDSVATDSTAADSAGRYAFLDIDTGYYALKAVLPNGQSYWTDSIHVLPGKTSRCDFSFGVAPPPQSGILYQGPVFLAGQQNHQIRSLPGSVGGYWYVYDDRDSGGASFTKPDRSISLLDSVKTGAGTIRGSLHLRPGELYPWAGVGFNWAGGAAVDLSITDGICIVYKANHPLWMSLTLTESLDTNTLGIPLPTAESFRTTTLAWVDMTWQYDSKENVTIAEALQRAEGINIQSVGEPGADSLDTFFEIQSVWLGQHSCDQ